jgi:hypothetical protein
MSVEQRWNLNGETSWCVVENGRPFRFTSERVCRSLLDTYPEGIASRHPPDGSAFAYSYDPTSRYEPEMYVEQRWNDAGEAMWCIIWQGHPYGFGRSETREVVEATMARHPEGMGTFGACPWFGHRTPPPPSWVGISDTMHLGVDVALRTPTPRNFSAEAIASLEQMAGRATRTMMQGSWSLGDDLRAEGERIRVSIKSTSTPPVPELPPVPPCKRCGADIYVSPYFTKGKPCPCL